ncbi:MULTISPECIES: branched-chain amino acid ABC transporter permease [Halomonadaceae]|uniref:branched-chain amino acid ABC transporter permease n=1 Tax=Halomonadaceae TaxID=28256 RepID=UPI00159A5984|nr:MULTISPECIES: branched-chain amino acid ABC transporter permease [Halomonas]QJQ94153.1 branched-chain amino acid ABC transporter permease [Halomonas sp. PA5]
MAFLDALLNGLTLGGMYALVAMGLTLQYGVARIMNLSYGEFLIAAAFATYWLFQLHAINPLLALFLVVPVAFALNWLIYQVLLNPLVKRSRTRGELEVNSILATFGLLFVIQGLVLLLFGSNYFSYTYINTVVMLAGSPLAMDRLLAVGFAVVIGALLYLALMRTRPGTALRAVSVDPRAAQLVGINVRAASAMAFALGGGLVAASGVLVSMFTTFNASMGVVFTMKALIVVIMGGAGNLLGALAAGLILGLAESFVSTYVAPGLTLAVTFALFLLVLLVRPTGMMGRAEA